MTSRTTTLIEAKAKVVTEFRLHGMANPVPLDDLAKRWGVVSIIEDDISSDGLLLSGRRGFTIVLNQSKSKARRRFSVAHELGHLLSYKCGVSASSNSLDPDPKEERLCDAIAAEILMPRLSFEEDAWMEGWSLRSLRTLSREYETSVPATARRMIELMPEPSFLSVWKPPYSPGGVPRLQWTDTHRSSYSVRNASLLPRHSLELIAEALDSSKIESGFIPVVDTKYKGARLTDFPAEALAWGRGDYRQAIVFHYPERTSLSRA